MLEFHSIDSKPFDIFSSQAIDVWTGVCLTFVFGALLEFALVNYASRSDAHREKMKKQRKQWEMEHQAALDAMAADGLLDDRNSFAMVRLFFFLLRKILSEWEVELYQLLMGQRRSRDLVKIRRG